MEHRRRNEPPPPPHDPLFDQAPAPKACEVCGSPNGHKVGCPADGPDAKPDPSMAIPPAVVGTPKTFEGEAKTLAQVAAVQTKVSSAIIAPPAKTTIARTTLEGQEVEVHSESASVAAQAKALVAARFLVAERRPRDVDEARVRILRECERPGFARVAEYSKPQGDTKVTGPSIRFAEAALRLFGNLAVDIQTIYDDAEKRTTRVTITDLETNMTVGKDVTFQKEVERKNVRRGQIVLGERVNTKGEVVFLVRATEDELLQKENALVSKTMRSQGLRLIPGDIIAEALETARTTRRNATAEDPDRERKRIADGFADLNVMPGDLKGYLGAELAAASPAQLDELRAVYVGIKEGDITWKEAMEAKAEKIAEEAEAPKPAAGAKVEALKAKLAAKKAANGGA
jgi:hypothetical protein